MARTPKREPQGGTQVLKLEASKVQASNVRAITEPEAHYIIAHETSSTKSGWVVIEHMDRWFDVRKMTKTELANLMDDLDREWIAAVAAGILNPH